MGRFKAGVQVGRRHRGRVWSQRLRSVVDRSARHSLSPDEAQLEEVKGEAGTPMLHPEWDPDWI